MSFISLLLMLVTSHPVRAENASSNITSARAPSCEAALITADLPTFGGGQLRLEVQEGVYAPVRSAAHNYGGRLLETALGPGLARARSILIIGTGAGLEAIVLARRSPAEIIATDVDPAAVALTRRNVARHGLENRVTVIESDLFARVHGRFDLILFNAPRPIHRAWMIEALGSERGERAWTDRICGNPDRFDPEGALITRCLREVDAHLADGGRFLLMSEERIAKYLAPGLTSRLHLIEPWSEDAREGNFAIHRITSERNGHGVDAFD